MLGCPIDTLTMEETVYAIDEKICSNESVEVGFVDAGKLANMQTDKALYRYILDNDIIKADGQSLVWLSKFNRYKLPERITGIDLMLKLFELAYRKRYRIFLLGAKEEIVSKVVKDFSKKYSPQIFAGYSNGYFSKDEERKIAEKIADSDAQLLFIGMGTPKKEEFIYKYKEVLRKINVKMGVGGAFDVVAGEIKRAPSWVQKIGMEWFFRFLQEPRLKWKSEVADSFRFLYLFLMRYVKGNAFK